MTAPQAPSLQVLDQRLLARFLERPNKYLAMVDLAGNRTPAFVPNPGRMRELFHPGVEVLLRPASLANPHRKTAFDLIAVRHRRRFVLIDSGVPNKFLKYLLTHHLLPELEDWDLVRPEPQWGNSQFDFLMEREGKPCLLEAKCCTYVVRDTATGIWECRFPDAPTTRGTRHVRELIAAKARGYRSVVMILVQAPGAERFRPNWETDSAFSEAFFEAQSAGVETYSRVLRFAGKRIYLGEALPVAIGVRTERPDLRTVWSIQTFGFLPTANRDNP